jgi:hypothetical protein
MLWVKRRDIFCGHVFKRVRKRFEFKIEQKEGKSAPSVKYNDFVKIYKASSKSFIPIVPNMGPEKNLEVCFLGQTSVFWLAIVQKGSHYKKRQEAVN